MLTNITCSFTEDGRVWTSSQVNKHIRFDEADTITHEQPNQAVSEQTPTPQIDNREPFLEPNPDDPKRPWMGTCGCKRRYVTKGACDVAHCTLYPSTIERGRKLSGCLW